MTLYYESIIKILFATFIGGLIGFEREVINRPAGFRTHILVCVASAIVMDVNLLLAATNVNMDPTRLGAQVISGIGFLGAGTIIKEGPTVKGLTTAASLWSIACIGLVVGAGYYLVALITAFIMLVTLKTFSQLEKKLTRAKRLFTLLVYTDEAPGRLGTITLILGEYNCRINKVTLSHEENTNHTIIEIDYMPPYGIKNIDIMHQLESLVGIIKVELKRADDEA